MSQNEQRRAPLASGMPMLGIGTWENENPAQCTDSVRTALEMGYRHVDTAQAYRNEEAVGRGIAEADVDREDVFLATKVWIDNLAHDDVLETSRESLDRLGVDYLDLLYVHWPAREYDPVGTMTALQELHDEGVVERIGVSNFEPRHLEEAQDELDVPIFANQVECHPLLPQHRLREYTAEHDIEFVAYSPLARGKVFDVPEIQEVAEKHDASAAQVSLAWLREKDVTTIPKATSEAHIRDNWESLDLELDGEDVEKIDGISGSEAIGASSDEPGESDGVSRRERQVDPSFGPWNQ